MASSAPAPRRLPGLDALRGVAALAVVVHHLPHYGAPVGLDAGWTGVDAFLVLSGYLLTLRPPGPGYARDRVARLLPVAVLAATLAGWHHVPAMLTGWARTDALSWPMHRLVWWSLGVEVLWYAVAPVVYRVPRRWLWWLAVAVVLAMPPVRLYVAATSGWWLAYAACRWDALAWGVLAGLGMRLPWWAVLAALAVAAGWHDRGLLLTQVVGYTAVGAVAAGVVPRVASWRCGWLEAVGRWSYPLYLLHPWALDVLPWWAAVPAAVAGSWVIHRWVEVPAGAWLRGSWRRARFFLPSGRGAVTPAAGGDTWRRRTRT